MQKNGKANYIFGMVDCKMCPEYANKKRKKCRKTAMTTTAMFETNAKKFTVNREDVNLRSN